MLTAALFTTAKTCKQPKCPSMQWIETEDVVHIYNGILLSHKKKNTTMPFIATWIDMKITILCEVRQRKINIVWYHLHAESFKKWYKWTYLQKKKRLTNLEDELMVSMGRNRLGV